MRKRVLNRREPEPFDGLADDGAFLFTAVGLNEQGARNLAAAVLYAACVDARKGNVEALDWLKGPEAHRWAKSLEIDERLWPPSPRVLSEMSVRGPKLTGRAATGQQYLKVDRQN